MRVLAINPWIYDFAAYDYWLKPYGFLTLLTYLKNHGAQIDYIDCVEEKITHEKFGKGKYFSEIIPAPAVYKKVKRHYKRYGISVEKFKTLLPQEKPDYILITSSMTYWYPVITDIIKIVREDFPDVPILLGGGYVTLCYDHAKKTFPDISVFANKELDKFFDLVKIPFDPQTFYATLPDYQSFYKTSEYAVMRTSWGCPLNCSYCAVNRLFPEFIRIPQEPVVDFIQKYAAKNIQDFVLYDDAFFYNSDYAKTLLQKIERLNLGLRFHTPNALHFRYLDQELARLLKTTGFVVPYFGLETMDENLQKEWGDKINYTLLQNGVDLLKQAGYKNGEFGAYLLLGYPHQDLEQLKIDVVKLHKLGVHISLAEFSPVPGTSLFKDYPQSFVDEPLLQNNSIFGYFHADKIQEFQVVKNLVKALNQNFA